MNYSIRVNKSVEKVLSKIDSLTAVKIRDNIRRLAIEPRPKNSIKMKGEEKTYRLRVGDYRVIYEIHDEQILVIVVNVGHRRDVYKRK